MTKTIRVKNLDCASCAAKLERAIGKVKGVENASVNFFAQKITFDAADDSIDSVTDDVCKVCKKVEPDMEIVGKVK